MRVVRLTWIGLPSPAASQARRVAAKLAPLSQRGALGHPPGQAKKRSSAATGAAGAKSLAA
jgi:hypothetical protein